MNIKENIKENSSSEESTLYERSKYSLDLVNCWIQNADSKVEISSAVMTFVFGIIAFIAEKILLNRELHIASSLCITHGLAFFSVITIMCFITSLWFHYKAIRPSLKSAKSKEDNNKPSFALFYADIAKMKEEEFYAETINADEKQFVDEVLKEIYINSGICTQKMCNFKKGLTLAFIGIISAVASCVLFYLNYVH